MTIGVRSGAVLGLLVAAGGCTTILGTFDFEGAPIGGAGGSTSSTGSGGGVSCDNGIKDGDESDVDCGGSCTGKLCADGKGCDQPSDCKSDVCAEKLCVPAGCADGARNGDETDIDCGGPVCPKCGIGKICSGAADCATGENGTPTCDGTCGFDCAAGHDDCDGMVGCETDITTKEHCGSCSVSCSAYCVAGSCNDPVAVSGGADFTCAILHDGTVWCWGYNLAGQLGDGTQTTHLQPHPVTLAMPAKAVAAGTGHACAVLADDSLWCWGNNSFGQLGLGDHASHQGPQKVPLPNADKMDLDTHTCVVTASHELYCWGNNESGQLGLGDSGEGTERANPTLILSDVSAVAVAEQHTCAIKTAGGLHCWGYYGGTAPAFTPPVTPFFNNVLEVVAGTGNGCLRTGVSVYCWGYNNHGLLGLGNTSNYTSPQPVSLAGVSQLAMSAAHTGAVTTNGLFMWGGNGVGQLGDGTAIDRTSPVMIPLSNVASLTTGSSHTCAVTADHRLFCWGYNLYGQLGNGTTAATSTPTPVVWP